MDHPLFGLYFDKHGERIDAERWGELHDDDEYVRIGLDIYPSLADVRDDPLDPAPIATVSTVWMGINHRFGPGDPLIFETMIFGGEYDSACQRYCTEAEAADGHRRVLDDLQHGRTPWFLVEEMETADDGE